MKFFFRIPGGYVILSKVCMIDCWRNYMWDTEHIASFVTLIFGFGK